MWVIAHPDDAEFSSAGTIARLAKDGKRIVIVQVTSGDKGTPDHTIPSTALASGREVEEKDAADVLGVDTVVYLRCTDGELVPDLSLREKIVRQIRTFKPDVIVTHDPFRPYALHPDHRACGFAALDAVYPTARDPHYFPEHLQDGLEPHKTAEIWFFNAEQPDLIVDITGTFDAKIASLKKHASQVGDGIEMEKRVRERNAEIAEGQPFELAEAYKTVQMRR
ncbi:MAG: PIG-L family deacetylase [Thermomicrobiales bacterium]|nr:PIG-L family deacetylase [Thermomicrobiales bacterium]